MGDTDEARRYLAKAKDAAGVTEGLTDLDDPEGMRKLGMLYLRVAEVCTQIAQTERLGQMARDTKATQSSMAEVMSKFPGLRDDDL